MAMQSRNGVLNRELTHRGHVPVQRFPGVSILRPAVLSADFPALFAWIHCDFQPERLQSMLTQTQHRSLAYPVPPAIQVIDGDGQTLVAAYFTRLPGQVATLGGVRARAEYADMATELMVGLCGELLALGTAQVQAILPLDDAATPAILAAANFRRLSTVQHMWLMSINATTPPPRAPLLERRGSLRWLDASQIAFRRLAKLVDDTFVGTLDCPALNGLRSQRQVLEGFLEGVPLRSIRHWEVLELEGELVGCLFLKQHEQQTIELAYMGIVPHQRGWGLGHALLNRSITQALRLRARHLVVAVDTNNAPAVHLYLRYGFLPDSKCSVWLL